MGVPLEAEKRYFEGFNEQGELLWRKFLRIYQDRFERFNYNVRVGQGLHANPGTPEKYRELWALLTKKRIDVVAERPGETWVIEVETRPGLRTLGQVIGYLDLLPQWWPVRDRLVGAVVSERMGFDEARLLRGKEILYFVFPPNSLPKLPPQFLPSTQSSEWYGG